MTFWLITRKQYAAVVHENTRLTRELNAMQAERKSNMDLSRRRLDESQAEIARLEQLVSEHHAAGALDGALIGDKCPVCNADR